jgi:oligoribonuclease NrnB/cAMP/cGMP phosphodiesterase (DHH superfamily)
MTHNDLDGVGSLILNEYYGYTDSFDKVYVVSYQEIVDNEKFVFPRFFPLTEDDDLVVTDVSMVPELYAYIKNTAKSYVIYDHHDETGKIEGDPNIHYNKKKSGTLLYFEAVTEGKRVSMKLKKLVDLINTYDNYNDESPLWEEAQNMNRVFYKVYSWGLKPYPAVQKFISLQVNKVKDPKRLEFGFSDYEDQKIQEVLEKEHEILVKARSTIQRRTDNAGNNFGLVVLASKISITCYNLLKEMEDLSYIIAINAYKGINGAVSVRARKTSSIDVNNLLGIHGHEKAGGGQFPVPFLIDFSRAKDLYLEYDPIHSIREVAT